MAAVHTKLGRVLAKETSVARHIPYTCHIDPYTVITENDDYVQLIKLQGISFETADNELINLLHDKRNNLLRGIAKGQIALWTTIIRQRITLSWWTI